MTRIQVPVPRGVSDPRRASDWRPHGRGDVWCGIERGFIAAVLVLYAIGGALFLLSLLLSDDPWGTEWHTPVAVFAATLIVVAVLGVLLARLRTKQVSSIAQLVLVVEVPGVCTNQLSKERNRFVVTGHGTFDIPLHVHNITEPGQVPGELTAAPRLLRHRF